MNKKEVKTNMPKRGSRRGIGGWAFLIGVVLAIVLGALGALTPQITWILIVIGVIVGLLNVADKETTPFLMSGAVLIIASSLGKDVVDVIGLLSRILAALLAIFVPATIIVAIKNVLSIANR